MLSQINKMGIFLVVFLSPIHQGIYFVVVFSTCSFWSCGIHMVSHWYMRVVLELPRQL